jgi:hypothetical protein
MSVRELSYEAPIRISRSSHQYFCMLRSRWISEYMCTLTGRCKNQMRRRQCNDGNATTAMQPYLFVHGIQMAPTTHQVFPAELIPGKTSQTPGPPRSCRSLIGASLLSRRRLNLANSLLKCTPNMGDVAGHYLRPSAQRGEAQRVGPTDTVILHTVDKPGAFSIFTRLQLTLLTQDR